MNNQAFQYRVSVIVPIYNVEQFLRTALDSLVDQTIPQEEMEVLMVDDGSPDRSIDIMLEYAEKHPNFKILRKENGGLSSARNYGIKHASGRYLMYLDADDWYSPETVKSCADFFDAHYEEIDLVDFKIIPISNGIERAPHYRYNTLTKSGVYDLTDQGNWYITQTNINICVKNLGQNNILFHENRNFRQEDQKYCTQVLQKKMKIGYCDQGLYYYQQQSGSITHSLFHAYYIFDSSTQFWEDLFGEYHGKSIPQYIQALYLNDINWKTTSDILLPYHYSSEALLAAENRLLAMLAKVDDCVILNHPNIGLYRKHFLLNLKSGRNITFLRNGQTFSIYDAGEELYSAENAEINVRRFRQRDDEVELTFVLKSPFFDYLPEKPQLFVEKNNHIFERTELSLRNSSWDYSGARIKTTSSWLADLKLHIAGIQSFCFYAVIGGLEVPCDVIIDWRLPFYRSTGKPFVSFVNNYVISCLNGVFTVRPATTKDLLIRHKWFLRSHFKDWGKRQYYMSKLEKLPACWLYYDCKGYSRNNGYFQFDHDFSTGDGITRYYVINEENFETVKHSFPVEQQPFLVQFGSEKHKLLYLSSSMIITAFIEDNNYNPFNRREFERYADLCRQHSLVYLQHGVLHAHLPWKYSRDRINVDYEVVSTEFEAQNLVQNYCFTEESLIRSGMPRYDYIDIDQESKRRILFAPSWRKYLISSQNGSWVGNPEKFRTSKFYLETEKFLNSPKLQAVLQQYDYDLDFKLHPIFNIYESLFPITNPRVHKGKTLEDAEYCAYISDFSSYTFDFAYLNRPILYFFPDYDLFRAGFCDYRELDLPLEKGFGPLVETADEMVEELKKLIENDCIPSEEYRNRENSFFLYYDSNCRSRIYHALSQID